MSTPTSSSSSSSSSFISSSPPNPPYSKMIQLLPLSLILLTIFSTNPAESKSIYNILKTRGLPMGLLPKGIVDFKFDESAGYFEAHLDQPCNAKYESEIHYDRNVSGTLSFGRIESLSGISAQELFLWFPVKGIRVDVPSSGLIYFDVGVVLKQFSLSVFETPKDCSVSGGQRIAEVEYGKAVVGGFFQSEEEKLRYRHGDQTPGRSVL
ncbi:hypothetical protein LINGRAHAP2_LOCUS9152 [Linum grandiflorum]